MTRIAGINILPNKRIEIGLTAIYGIGRSRSREICHKLGINLDTKVSALTETETEALRKTISQDYRVEGDARREVLLNIKRLVDLGCYRGRRHRLGLPARGQRTKTNAQTNKRRRKKRK